jgi:signal transduction histidine kinase
LLTGVLLGLIWSLASNRDRATKLGRKMIAQLNLKTGRLTISEERLHLALDGSDLALFDWNVSTGRVELSGQWATMLGRRLGPARPLLKSSPAWCIRTMRRVFDASCARVLTGEEKSYSVEHRVKTGHGEWLWILSRAKVVERSADGRAVRVTGTNADITARKLVEQMKTEFVGNVSHELRTPLTVVIGALELLQVYFDELTPDQEAMLTMACESSAQLQMLIDDILDFEKISSGVMPFNLQPIALAAFLQRALELNRITRTVSR